MWAVISKCPGAGAKQFDNNSEDFHFDFSSKDFLLLMLD